MYSQDAPTMTDQQLSEEAAEWFLHMSSPEEDQREVPYADTSARDAAFLEWCSRSPEHLRAFLDMCEIDHCAQRMDLQLDLSVQAGSPPGTRGRPVVIKLALAASVVLAAFTVPVPDESVQASPRPYSTAIGERQTINLEDGSSITLNTRSRVSVLFGPKQREVRLLAGEVFFHVLHDPERPFRVFSNGILLEDMGTDFNVYNHRPSPDQMGTGPASVRVSVLNGSVRLYCSCLSNQTTASLDSGVATLSSKPSPFVSDLLVAGQEGEITHINGVDRLQIQRLSQDDLLDATAWRNGEIILNKMTLAQAVEEFNRYNLQQMTVAPEIARLVVGGRFDNPDYRNFVAAVSFQYHVQALPPHSAGNPSPALRLVQQTPP